MESFVKLEEEMMNFLGDQNLVNEILLIMKKRREGSINVVSETDTQPLKIAFFSVKWVTVKKKKYFNTRYTNHPFIPLKLEVASKDEWKKIRTQVYKVLAPEILKRSERISFRRAIKQFDLDLRIMLNKRIWNNSIDPNKIEIIDCDKNLRAVLVKLVKEHKSFLVTPAGTFDAGFFKESVLDAMKFALGLTGKHVRSWKSLITEIERQLEMREQIVKIYGSLSRVPNGRVTDLDPRYGAIIDDIFCPVGDGPKVKLPPHIRTIPELLFALYGEKVSEKPDFEVDIYSPPWTLRRFGEKRKAYLIEDQPDADLSLFLQKGYLYLAFGEKTYRVKEKLKKNNIEHAFASVFGIDLPPQATREDVEAIIAMAMLN